ncbi:MAG: HAD family hydrolase [Aestuariibacter sp.]
MPINGALALSSWRDGQAKQDILKFVEDVCNENSEFFVPEPDRIAVFDNDGTLWVEKPLMTQIEFIRDQIRPENDVEPEQESKHSLFDKIKDAFEDSVVDLLNDLKNLSEELLDGVTTDEYKAQVSKWIAKTRHPRYQRLYTELVYQPMMEVLQLFMQNNIQCYIVSGGSTDFVRPWCEDVYNIPTQNIIGSSLRTRVVEKDGELALEYLPVPFYFDNGDAKVRSIGRLIGKQPIAAFGNSHGDAEMLRWVGRAKRHIAYLIHHTDAVREYQYSPDPKFLLGKGTLELAKQYDWCVVDMKNDWATIFSFEND